MAEKKKGRFIGEYEIKGRPLGSGGMATVHLVSKDGKEFAAKVLHQHLMRDRRTVNRFKKEFEIGQKMKSSRAFVKMLELIKEEGCWTIIMEYVPGLTLDEVIKKLGPFSPKEATAYIYELSKALRPFHMNNYVHRDLKLENLVLDKDFNLKLIDLGTVT